MAGGAGGVGGAGEDDHSSWRGWEDGHSDWRGWKGWRDDWQDGWRENWDNSVVKSANCSIKGPEYSGLMARKCL